MPHLRLISRKRAPAEHAESFPFTVPVVRRLEKLDVSAKVVFFVGENGSGKSTLLEGIASAAALPTVGSDDSDRDATLASQRLLGRTLSLSWTHRTHRGFFLRAEDFFGFQRRLARERVELETRLSAIDEEFADATEYVRGLAKGPVAGSLREMEDRYGKDPDARSHGEAFINLFRSRFVPGGLYLLDEPEAALSPQNQLGLLAMIMNMLGENAQFIVATHSPILLGLPGACIYEFDGGTISQAEYGSLDHVRVTRDFLNDPERFLRHLV
ncbi:MAG: AAA family ATPase [Gemmatimonas sp.]